MRAPRLMPLVLLLALASPARAGLLNGSFEPPAPFSGVLALAPGVADLSPWTVTGEGVHWQCATFELPAADGVAYLDIAQGGVEQAFATNAGSTYEVRFAILGSPGATVTVSAAGTTQAYSGSSASVFLSWEQRSFRFVARSSLTTLAFQGGPIQAGPMLLDRVTVLPGQSTPTETTSWGQLKQAYR